MKKIKLHFIKQVGWIAMVVLMAAACQDEKFKIVSEETLARHAARDNNEVVMATQDVLDLTAGALASKGIAGGRTAHGDDDHDGECKPSITATFNLDRNHPDTLIYSGSFTINYGDGSMCDSATSRRTGKLTDEFMVIISLKNRAFSSTETITFEAFAKDTVQLDGAIIVKSATGQPTSAEAQNAKITYPDGTSLSWNGTLLFAHERNGHSEGDKRGITTRVTGSITGTTRDGATFSANITEEVVFKTGCFGRRKSIPVSGIVDITTNGVQSIVDYGDDDCDRTYTVTVAGETTEHTFS